MQLTVATWNVENLFRPGGPYGPRNDTAYDAKLEALAATIERIAPDVVAVQEIGEPEALDDLVDRLDGAWSTRLSPDVDSRGIGVGFLTRTDVVETEPVVEFPPLLESIQADDDGGRTTRMGRGALRIVVRGGAQSVELVTAHLKSKLLSYPGGRFDPRDEDERARFGAYALYRRAAEATTVRIHAGQRLAGQGTDRAMIVLGDLNDTTEAATTQILLGPGGSEIGTPGEDRPDEGDPWRLWNLAPLIPEEERYSRIYRGRRELIDHILVSRALLDRVTEVRAVVDRPLPSIDDYPVTRRDDVDSDHAPVVARFELDG